MSRFITTSQRGNKIKMKNELQVISGRWLNCLCFLMFGKYCPLNDDSSRGNKQYCNNCKTNRQVNLIWGNKFFLPPQWFGLNLEPRESRTRRLIYRFTNLYSTEIISLFYLRNTKYAGLNSEKDLWYDNKDALEFQGFYQLYNYPIPIDIIRLILQRLIYIVMKDVRIFVSFSHPSDYELKGIETRSENGLNMMIRGFGHLFKDNMLINIK
jgi:hypothetical protein